MKHRKSLLAVISISMPVSHRHPVLRLGRLRQIQARFLQRPLKTPQTPTRKHHSMLRLQNHTVLRPQPLARWYFKTQVTMVSTNGMNGLSNQLRGLNTEPSTRTDPSRTQSVGSDFSFRHCCLSLAYITLPFPSLERNLSKFILRSKMILRREPSIVNTLAVNPTFHQLPAPVYVHKCYSPSRYTAFIKHIGRRTVEFVPPFKADCLSRELYLITPSVFVRLRMPQITCWIVST
jgi:hypothetical protein